MISLDDLTNCFEGAIPAVMATASADGVPNVTYLSRVRAVDSERIALSNQFFSKTLRNLAENPRGSMLLIDPTTYDEYRLTLVYERTERRGPVFEQLRADVDVAAAFHGMEDVFHLRAADIYRVVDVELIRPLREPDREPRVLPGSDRLAEFIARLSRCSDLDTIVAATVEGLESMLGFEHSLLLLIDEEGKHLYTMASNGYPFEGVGSEVEVGDGIIGMAAGRATPIRIGNLRQMAKYGHTVRRSYEVTGEIGPGREIPVPALELPESRVAVPALALGQLVGVLAVDSGRPAAFTENDEAMLTVVATVVANAIEVDRVREATEEASATRASAPASPRDATSGSTRVRFFAVDGSTFVDGDYLIKGVAGRILWSLLGHYDREQRVEFTNKEVRLDPSLELPEFRDNLDSRLILLKRRLDERAAPIRIEKTGRGRFRLIVDTTLALEEVPAPAH